MKYENHFKGENLNGKAIFLFYKNFTNQDVGKEYTTCKAGFAFRTIFLLKAIADFFMIAYCLKQENNIKSDYNAFRDA